MAPLKFRAWAVEDNEMHYDVQNGLQSVGMSSPATFGEIVEDTADFRVMQSTGLTDKSGKEIFEGDRVKLSWKAGHGYTAGQETGVVEWGAFDDGEYWEYDTWLLRIREGKAPLKSRLRENNHAEVVGNIYQNPDLLSKAA